jgi:hypothetical protein
MNRMGATVSQLHSTHKELLKAYIEMSYDSSAEIERIVAAAEPATPVLILETAQLVRSCGADGAKLVSSCQLYTHTLDTFGMASTSEIYQQSSHGVCALRKAWVWSASRLGTGLDQG